MKTKTDGSIISLTERDIIAKQEYNRIMGLDTTDIGSRANLIREVKKKFKAKGYKTGKVSKMPVKQLKAIFYEN